MSRHTLNILGLEITFRTDADDERIAAAQTLLEERFKELDRAGGYISKEKLLVCLCLSLADDYLETKAKLELLDEKIEDMLSRQS